MASTPKRLFGPAQLTASTATKYTVPSGTKTIVRYIEFSNPDSAAHAVTLSVGADAAGTRIYDAYPIAAGAKIRDWVYLVLETTEIIAAFADAASHVVLTIDGDERTL